MLTITLVRPSGTELFRVNADGESIGETNRLVGSLRTGSKRECRAAVKAAIKLLVKHNAKYISIGGVVLIRGDHMMKMRELVRQHFPDSVHLHTIQEKIWPNSTI